MSEYCKQMKIFLVALFVLSLLSRGYCFRVSRPILHQHGPGSRLLHGFVQKQPQQLNLRKYTCTKMIVDTVSQSSAINAAAIKAVSKLVSTCGIGVVASKNGLLDAATLAMLSKLVFNVFQPCLLFVNVASTVAKLATGEASGGAALYILPFAAFFQIISGYIVGRLVATIVYGKNRKSENGKILQACTTFGNSGPLPLVFTDALFRDHPDPTLLGNSVAYISMYLLGWSPVFWMICPGILSENTGRVSFKERLQVLRKRVITPPVLGSLTGMAVASTPPLRNLLIAKTGLLNPVFEAMRTISAAYLPTVLMILAGSLTATASGVGGLADSGSSTAAGINTDNQLQTLLRKIKDSAPFASQVLFIYAARFLIMPLLTFTLAGLANQYIPAASALFNKDPLLLLTLLLLACMPSAQNGTVILNMQKKKDAAGRVARILLCMYVLGIPAMSYWLIRILKFTGLSV